MANRLLKYNSQSDYEAAKGSLLIPYVAIYPSITDGKTVVVYANADGTNTSEVIATAQLTNLINALSNELDGFKSETNTKLTELVLKSKHLSILKGRCVAGDTGKIVVDNSIDAAVVHCENTKKITIIKPYLDYSLAGIAITLYEEDPTSGSAIPYTKIYNYNSFFRETSISVQIPQNVKYIAFNVAFRNVSGISFDISDSVDIVFDTTEDNVIFDGDLMVSENYYNTYFYSTGQYFSWLNLIFRDELKISLDISVIDCATDAMIFVYGYSTKESEPDNDKIVVGFEKNCLSI